ncbi:MAG: NADPH-dependent F420 reductase [Candidatus Acidiferrales bacterium]
MPSPLRIGLLGGTGIEGKGLALRFAHARASVILGSRSRERAAAVAQELNQRLGRESIQPAENREMLSQSDLVLLTVPFAQAAEALDTYRNDFRPGLTIVDATVPVKSKTSPGPGDLPEGSGSQFLAKHLPEGVHLVGAFKTIPAHILAELEVPLDCDAFVCGDSEPDKARVMEAIRLIPGLRPVDVGGLDAAATLERMTALAIRINRRYKLKGARFRVVGL